jgi:hypothetical protein
LIGEIDLKVEVADEHHLQQQTEIMAISGSSTHQQSAVVVNRENSVCGELPKSARVLRMVNRLEKELHLHRVFSF